MDFLHVLEHHLIDQKWGTLQLGSLAIPFSKHAFLLCSSAVLLTAVIPLLARRWQTAHAASYVPSGSRGLLEIFVMFIRDQIVIPNMGHEGLKYLPYFLTLFFFILTSNLIGLIPGSATATGNISVTAALAVCTLLLMNFAGIREHGFIHHVKNFVPHGVPGWLAPLVFPLEVIGMFAKAFALTVRLFANMIAGHIVILAFLSLIFLVGGVMIIPSVALALAMMMLELFVCFVQAFIFTFLTSIFVGSTLHPH
ncbi:MAG: F0F1 ATP synthase subunit A [Elusimicrobiota bacterium]